MSYQIEAREFQKKSYESLGATFSGTAPTGETIGFTNYYMERKGKPILGISGEFHFSRMDERRWEDELIKLRMGGVTIVSTYIFWNHHEEEEGIFTFEGRKNLRQFMKLCQEQELSVILRIGPFDHGEVRNGGLPDWLYGKPFEVRKLNDGFMHATRRLYEQIGEQTKGLYFQDGGPIIAAQIENEYMHSSAPWELTTGISNEWVFGGDDKEAYMLALLQLAKECGILAPFYTCTGWGGAIAPKVMLPLWGGYAYRPWIFYSGAGEHPATEEYIYQDYHNNQATVTSDFQPSYPPEERPYACCEMGGGMMNTYYYRFALPYKSVDAMSNIKLGGGCNLLGYYMYHGGTNPKGKHGMFLNEGQVPKLSYDYQAALGEFGQLRESYQRLKTIHQFCQAFGESLCSMQTILPKGASQIAPSDLDTLRFAIRTDGTSGFLFLNNFQDHRTCKDKENEKVEIHLKEETIIFDELSLAAEENSILPFHMDMEGIDLVTASAQPVTKLWNTVCGYGTYVFLKPAGMNSKFVFEEGVQLFDEEGAALPDVVYRCRKEAEAERFTVKKGEQSVELLCLNRSLTNQMYLCKGGRLLFTQGALLEDPKGLRLETTETENRIAIYPNQKADHKLFEEQLLKVEEKQIPLTIKQTGESRYTVTIPQNALEGLKDARLQIWYRGDIGMAFIDGEMVSDNFCNGEVWEIGLLELMDRLKEQPLTIVITPLKKGAGVNVESAMAARMETFEEKIAQLDEIKICPVFEVECRI